MRDAPMNPLIRDAASKLLRSAFSADPGKVFQDSFSSFTSQGAFFARSLESLISEVFEIKYPEFKWSQFIPVRSGVDEGAESFVYRIYDQSGLAEFVDDGADDLPEASLEGAEQIKPIRSLGAAFGWTIQDIRAAALGRVPLDRMKADTARRMIERKIEEIMATGDTARGIEGFVNNSLMTGVSPTTGTWTSATGEQILTDINKLVNQVVTDSKETFLPDTLLLPSNRFSLVATKPYSSQDPRSVLKAFLDNSPYIRTVESWHYLDSVGGAVRAIAYKRDPMVVDAVVPIPFEVLPMQAKNLRQVFPCHARVGGATVRYPVAVRYMDGI